MHSLRVVQGILLPLFKSIKSDSCMVSSYEIFSGNGLDRFQNVVTYDNFQIKRRQPIGEALTNPAYGTESGFQNGFLQII